jgi:hypothetical protein
VRCASAVWSWSGSCRHCSPKEEEEGGGGSRGEEEGVKLRPHQQRRNLQCNLPRRGFRRTENWPKTCSAVGELGRYVWGGKLADFDRNSSNQRSSCRSGSQVQTSAQDLGTSREPGEGCVGFGAREKETRSDR